MRRGPGAHTSSMPLSARTRQTHWSPGPQYRARVAGITDLAELIRSMHPVQVAGEFVHVSVDAPDPDLPAHAMVREPEGITYVLPRAEADRRGLAYDFVAAWITLRVHSALEAVGLTAAVSAALASAGISCNVLAGRVHDHLLVPHERSDEAVAVLVALARSSAPD